MPDGIFGNESLGYLRQWLLTQGRIVAIIDVPIETFMPNTSTKTSILIFQKLEQKDIVKNYPVFMAVAEKCGHDRRGREIERDDITEVPLIFKKWSKENNFSFKIKKK